MSEALHVGLLVEWVMNEEMSNRSACTGMWFLTRSWMGSGRPRGGRSAVAAQPHSLRSSQAQAGDPLSHL